MSSPTDRRGAIDLAVRPARPADAAAIAAIYSQGIEDRIATFETEPRTEADVAPWFDTAHAIVAVTDPTDRVVGYAVAHPYADRCCYRGIGEYSVYVDRAFRGAGVGRVAMEALVEAARAKGLWKLLSRIFPENRASLALMARLGFREVGVHEKHGKLDGAWKDTVIVERLIPENLD
jgi:L-amino acid N-acyltransferase YncA